MPILDYVNPYSYIMRIRRMMYERGWLKSYHPGIPVISVGNLTVGGTGKSPMVLLIAKYLEQKRGKRLAIISRGYKRHTSGFLLVSNAREIIASVEDSGDEAQMLAELLPNAIVIVDEDRVRGAMKAKELGVEVIILDDGFQHLRLKRDLNILLIDGISSPVLPFGRSREPVSAAKAADVVVKSDGKDASDSSNAVVRSVPSSLMSFTDVSVPLTELKWKRILALSSIANPERFYNMLRGLGATVALKSLGDHAEYSDSLVRKILNHAETHGVEMIVTTDEGRCKIQKIFRTNPDEYSYSYYFAFARILTG